MKSSKIFLASMRDARWRKRRSESLEKIGINGFPPLLCETDRYLVPLIGWINGPGCGVTGVQVARRGMDGTREKKRRFSTWGKDHGRWIRGGG